MKTLIVNYRALNIGGIENFIFDLVSYCQANNYRTIWITDCEIVDEIYKSILDKIEIYRIRNRKYSKRMFKGLKFDMDDEVTIISFSPFEMNASLLIKNNNPNVKIMPMYIVANAKGRFYYIEENFIGFLSCLVKAKMRKTITEWFNNHWVYFYTDIQYTSLVRKYEINTDNLQFKDFFIPALNNIDVFDEKLIKQKDRNKSFNLVSVSRFSFPHKNYLLGLVNDYAILKDELQNLKLYIIGYGEDQAILEKRIIELPEHKKKDIFLLGKKSKEEIKSIMKNMHFNISTAGSVSCGAINGVVSIPARNFCTDQECQVYGWLPESKNKTTSLEEGQSSIEYIRTIATCSNDEYFEFCKKSHQAYALRNVNPEFIFEQINHGLVKTYRINHFNVLAFLADVFWKLRLIFKIGEANEKNK